MSAPDHFPDPGYGDRPEFDEDPGPEDAVLDRAWDALDAGRHEDALAALEELDPDWPGRWIPEALARTELGELARARTVLDQARELADVEDDPDYLWAAGQLLLREWKIEAAAAKLTRLLDIDRTAAALERLSLCAEISGDIARADRLLAEAQEVDPEYALPPRLSPDDFERVIGEAIDALPEAFRDPIETTEIVVEPVPSDWMIDTRDPSETPPDMLGLFVGASELERGEYGTDDLMPRRIFLFQRNLERATRTHDELVEEIRITLFHELGHMLGFDEEGVSALGLE